MMVSDDLQIRCSALHLIMSDPRNKEQREAGELSSGAKSHISNLFKQALVNSLGFESQIGFSGSKYTEKGLVMEDLAIAASGRIRARMYQKNSERLNNGYLTGECDIYDQKNRLIIDTKCTYSIDTHPFFQAEAEKKAIEAGYDWQMQGYLWLYGCDVAEIDFWLLPMPEDMLKQYENRELMIEAIQSIPLVKRVTTVQIKRNEVAIKQIQRKVEAAKLFYKQLVCEFENKQPLTFGKTKNSEAKTESKTETPNLTNRKKVLL